MVSRIIFLANAIFAGTLCAQVPVLIDPPPLILRPQGQPIESPTESMPTQSELVSILKHQVNSAPSIETKDAPEWFQAMVQRIVRENLPEKYVHDKDWGRTDRRWDGLHVRRDGLRISTKRRWKEVNHGTWRRYEISQIEPASNLHLRIENVQPVGDGNIGFDVSLISKLHAFGRQSKWTKGVQAYSISADADAEVQIRIGCQLGMRLDFSKLPPDVILVPNVTAANIDLQSFRLKSISKLDGPLVKQLGHRLQKVLTSKLEEKREQLPQKINRQIAKNEDKLMFSLSDFASKKWKSFVAGAPVETNETKTGDGQHRSNEVGVVSDGNDSSS